MSSTIETNNNIDKAGALGEFLRATRERLAPEDFGLPKGRWYLATHRFYIFDF